MPTSTPTASARVKHALYTKKALCALPIDDLLTGDVSLAPDDSVTCALCIEVRDELTLAAVVRRAAHDAGVPVPLDETALPDVCPPDCTESCCVGDETPDVVDMEELQAASDETPEPDASEALLVLYTSTPASCDLGRTMTVETWTGTLGDAADALTVRRVMVPQSDVKAQRLAYIAVPDTLTASATQWATLAKSGAWHPAAPSVPVATPAAIVPPPAPDHDAPDEPPPAPVDHLLYTNAPDACDLRRTDTVDPEAGVYGTLAVRLVRLHPEDVVRQTKMYLMEDGCVAIEPAAWEAYQTGERALGADVAWFQELCGQGADAIKAALRAGTLQRRDPNAPPTTRRTVAAPRTDAAKAARVPKTPSDGSSVWRQAPAGLVIPPLAIVPGPQDTSPIPAEHVGHKTGHCVCGQRWYGNSNRGNRCPDCWKAYMAHRNSYIDAALASDPHAA